VTSDQGPLAYSPLTPYLVVSDAVAAIAFYTQAFGAEERSRMPTPDGRKLLHAQLAINGGTLMLSDDFAEDPAEASTPEALGGSPVTIHLLTSRSRTKPCASERRRRCQTSTSSCVGRSQGSKSREGPGRTRRGHNWSLGTPDELVSDEPCARERRRRCQTTPSSWPLAGLRVQRSKFKVQRGTGGELAASLSER